LGDIAIEKGQLASGQVAANEQVMPLGGGTHPGPGIPALALRALPGGVDLLAGSLTGSRGTAALQLSLSPRAMVR
jgi:hypothetical protein